MNILHRRLSFQMRFMCIFARPTAQWHDRSQGAFHLNNHLPVACYLFQILFTASISGPDPLPCSSTRSRGKITKPSIISTVYMTMRSVAQGPPGTLRDPQWLYLDTCNTKITFDYCVRKLSASSTTCMPLVVSKHTILQKNETRQRCMYIHIYRYI